MLQELTVGWISAINFVFLCLCLMKCGKVTFEHTHIFQLFFWGSIFWKYSYGLIETLLTYESATNVLQGAKTALGNVIRACWMHKKNHSLRKIRQGIFDESLIESYKETMPINALQAVLRCTCDPFSTCVIMKCNTGSLRFLNVM